MEDKHSHHHDAPGHCALDARGPSHGHVHAHGSSGACISQVPVFNHLEAGQMDEIMEATRSASYRKGELIYRAGDESDSLYIVNSGKIRIYRLSESGKEQLVRILLPGDFTGELALFRKSIHEAYAEAMEPTQVCVISRGNLQQYLIKYPQISLRILSEFSERLERSEKQTTRFATERVETRIALFLAECLEQTDTSMTFQLPMSRKDLASYLGTTPETISRKLAEFEDAGLIQQQPHRRIRVLDPESLRLV